MDILDDEKQEKIITYTLKLNSNLNYLKNAIKEIIEIPNEDERNIQIENLYKYFNKRTIERNDALFSESDPYCIKLKSAKECIYEDIRFLRSKCNTDLIQKETKNYCQELINDIQKEFLNLFNFITNQHKNIPYIDITKDIVDLFIEKIIRDNKKDDFKHLTSDMLNQPELYIKNMNFSNKILMMETWIKKIDSFRSQ